MKSFKKSLAFFLSVLMVFTTVVFCFPGISAKSIVDNPEETAALAREIAREGMVLLKNENQTLPLAASDKVSVFGRTQYNTVVGGLGSAYVYSPYVVNVIDGLTGNGVNVDAQLAEDYRAWCVANPPANEGSIWGSGLRYHPEMPISNERVAQSKATGSNKAVVVISRIPGENTDMGLGRGEFYLQDLEKQMLEVVAANFDHIIVVLNIGSIIDLKFIDEYGVDSVVYMNLAGQEGGNALADILKGTATPSAKLSDTVAKNYDDYPTSKDFGGKREQVYSEDIFVGYRYFETFDPEDSTVLYPFGFGLSYTTFSISQPKVEVKGDKVEISATVTNTGSTYSGKEVLQAYFSAPQMGEGENDPKLGKPAKELVAFAKTKLLAPGASEKVTMSFPLSDMASFDDTGATGNSSCWVLEKGQYDFYLGNSIRDARSRLVGSYTQPELAVTERSKLEQPIDSQVGSRLLANGEYEEILFQGKPQPPADGWPLKVEGISKVEAENYSSSTSKVRIEDFTDATTGDKGQSVGYMHKDERVTYTLNAERAGKYRLKFRYSNAYGDKQMADMMEIKLGGGTSMIGLNLTFPQTTSPPNWFNFSDSGEVIVVLPKGSIDFNVISHDDQFINIDYMTFEYIDQGEHATVISATGITKVEMEDFYDSSPVVRAEGFANDGSGNMGYCLAYMHTAGNYATYRLHVEEPGEYRLTFRYASANSQITLKNMARLWIGNVEEVNFNDITFHNTAVAGNTYHNFRMSDPIVLQMPAGDLIFKVESKTVSFANLDYIQFEKVSQPVQSLAAIAPLAAVNLAAAQTLMLEDVYDNPALMDAFLAQMSVEELAQLSGGNSNNRLPGVNTNCFGGLTGYGIPNAQTADGPCGLRVLPDWGATAWPCSALIGNSWDVAIAEQFGVAQGKECKNATVDFWLAPGINIHRDPRGGRNFEYFSEDPYLTGKMGAAVTNGVQSQNVGVTVKHYAVNNTEYDRLSSNSRISERAMREIYLKNFEIVIKESQPYSIMSSYNRINGQKASTIYEILTVIARQEWGWEGFFMTDWGSGADHVLEAIAGNELKMPSGSPSALAAAVRNESNELTRERLEENVARILNGIMKTNCFLSTLGAEPIVHTISDAEVSKIKLVEHSRASSKISSETCEDADGGQSPTYTNQGEWMQYEIDVKRGGTYRLDARVSCFTRNAAFTLTLNGTDLISFVNPQSDGGYQNWATREVGEIYLPAGRHKLRMNITATGSNYNYFLFTPLELDSAVKAELPALIEAGIPFTFSLTTEAYGKLRLYNENGSHMGITIVSREVQEDGSVKTVLHMAIGTPGVGRVLSVYDGERYLGDFTFDVAVVPKALLDVSVPETVVVNEQFEADIHVQGAFRSITLFNDANRKMGIQLLSKTANADGTTTFKVAFSIGTAGIGRTFHVYEGTVDYGTFSLDVVKA